MKQIIITAEMEKLIAECALNMFEDMAGDPTYPFTHPKQQEEEFRNLYRSGGITEAWIRSATDKGLS